VPTFAADPKSEVVPLAFRLAGQNEAFAVSYCTEAGLFQNGGVPAIICGPGDIAQAHTPNEFIRIDELEKCLVFLGRLADWAER
jgi:acetylornithine deacetylase